MTKKATTDRARERVARAAAAAVGNNPAGGYDEEAQIQAELLRVRSLNVMSIAEYHSASLMGVFPFYH
jgi:hypothetical protein